MPLLGFSTGSTDVGPIGKSLDEIIADRRKEQIARASKDKTRKSAKDKKNAIADRSIATGRAKRAAATRARRSLSNKSDDKKPSAMEVEKEVYRQSRKTAVAKKKAEKKVTNGRLAPNSSLRDKKSTRKNATNKGNAKTQDPPGPLFGRLPQRKQIKAAIQGMYDAGCPVPDGYQVVMQFSPIEEKEKGKEKGNQPNKNSGNQKNGNRRRSGRNN